MRIPTRWLKLARGLLECPTAPLREEAPARYVLDFAAARPALFCRRDAAGNILLGFPRNAARARAPLVLVAHLDHPGFWIEGARGGLARLIFRGGVNPAHVRPGTGVRFFERGSGRETGRGRLVRVTGRKGRLHAATARVMSGCAPAGGFATWDFPGWRLRGGRIVSRGCDDSLGCAVLLCVLEELARAKRRGEGLWALFTRAEEAGFCGAFGALSSRLLPRGARVISVECSRALPSAPQGAGVIVRVGDRAAVFDAGVTEALRQVAESLRRRRPRFQYQRKLMDGGACEAFVFGARGYRASGVALPLGNYHNQAGLDGGRRGIGPEHVLAADFVGAVELLLELARQARRWRRLERGGEARLVELARRARRELRAQPLLLSPV